MPVLAGSSAFTLAEAFDWYGDLDAKPRAAVPFYAVIAAGITLGVVADLAHLDAVWALFWSAVVNGFVAIPLLAGVLLTANRPDLMGQWINGTLSARDADRHDRAHDRGGHRGHRHGALTREADAHHLRPATRAGPNEREEDDTVLTPA